MSKNISSIDSCEKIKGGQISSIDKKSITQEDLSRYRDKVSSYSGGLFTRPIDADPNFRYYWVTNMVLNQINPGRMAEMQGLEWEPVPAHECPMEAARHGFDGSSHEPISHQGMVLMKLHNAKWDILQEKPKTMKKQIRRGSTNPSGIKQDKRESIIEYFG